MESFPPNKKKIIIAVDGFSSCGKSTFAREVAARIGYIFIDTGAMYRAVTLLGLRRGAIGPDGVDEKALTDLLSEADISFRFNPGRGASDIYLDGENVESRIRGIEVSNSVSRVSSIGAVREKLVASATADGEAKGCRDGWPRYRDSGISECRTENFYDSRSGDPCPAAVMPN